MRWLFACLVGTLFLFDGFGGGGSVLAAQPEPWQMGFQPAGSPIMERVVSLHSLLFWIITVICLVVLALLLYVCVKFKESSHPIPSRRSHNTLLEVVWTAVPVLILVIIAIPSFRLLYFADVVPPTDITVKATGKQWYWTYEYPDNGNFTFDAFMLTDDELEPGMPRLLATSEHIVLPVGTDIRMQITAADVLHSWAMPSLGVKVDAVPGRLNELWLHINEPGIYYGQCSELCGVNHGYMPITIEAVTPEAYEAWVADAQTRFAKVDAEPVHVANR